MSGLFRWLVGSITTSPTTDPVEWMASRARSERRKPQLRKVESMSSSREASEESNAENTEGELLTSDASDEVVLPAVVHPGSSGGSEGILDSEALPGRVRAGVRAVGPTNTLLARGSFADPAAEDSSASTYDGDVSSATAASKRHNSQTTAVPSDSTTTHPLLHERAVHTACNNTISPTASPPSTCPPSPPTLPLRPPHQHEHEHKHTEAHAPAPHGMISKISPEELQDFIRHIITGDLPGPNGQKRTYSINPPPLDRPVRIYADGVYDLFHYAHALQLRQAKLFFPHVHLLVGVSSDELVKSYKALPVLNSEERYESVRNCKWVDEVIEDAPWEVDQAFIDKHQIDYIAHDEEPYVSLTSSDVYAYAKSIGKFLPTRRTSGISTSELLSRIVDGYRGGDYDNKLSKIGRSDIMSRPPSENGSARSRTNSRLNSPVMGSSSAALDRSLTGLTMSSRSQSPIRPQPAHPLEQSQLA